MRAVYKADRDLLMMLIAMLKGRILRLVYTERKFNKGVERLFQKKQSISNRESIIH